MDALTFLSQQSSFTVKAKPKSRKTKLDGYDEGQGLFIVAVAAPPEDGKANKELERYLSKLLGKKVVLKSGASSRKKRFVVVE